MLVMRLIVSNLFTALFICLIFSDETAAGRKTFRKISLLYLVPSAVSRNGSGSLFCVAEFFLHRRCFMKVSQHLPSEGKLMIYTSVFQRV